MGRCPARRIPMELDLNRLRPQERLSLRLRLLYEEAGFRQYHMGRFEEYGLYQENRRFLASDQVITFTDLDGRLLALKPDVTLSIAKNARVEEGGCGQYYYAENVYRPSQESHTFREISQMGLECIGAVDDAVIVTHDSVRPFVKVSTIEANISALADCDACDTVIPATDTIVESDKGLFIDSIPERRRMFQGRRPRASASAPSKRFTDVFPKTTDASSPTPARCSSWRTGR